MKDYCVSSTRAKRNGFFGLNFIRQVTGSLLIAPRNETQATVQTTDAQMKYVLLLIFAVVAYLVWDGFVPRELEPSSLSGGARVVTDNEVAMVLLPDLHRRKYIAVSVNNPTDMIVRSVTIAAPINVGADTVIEIPRTKCAVAGRTDLRILAHTDADGQTCVVSLERREI